ncbi:MAG: MFS transporter [Actinobacteria bacterium]|nr:MFS transporter [Actinomycetota bacterium]
MTDSSPLATETGELPIIRPGSARSALSHEQFRRIFIASFGSNIGSWIQNVVLPIYIYNRTGKASVVALLIFAQMGPLLLLAIPAGVIADAVNRRKWLQAMQLVMLTFSVVLAALARVDAPIWAIFLAQLGVGIGGALNMPAWSALLPSLVPQHDLPGAMSLNSTLINGSRVVGPILVALLSPLGAEAWHFFAFNALTYLLVVWALSRTHTPHHAPDPTRGWKRFTFAFRVAKERPVVRRLLLSLALYSLISLPYIGLFPAVAELNFGINDSSATYKWLYATWALGAALDEAHFGFGLFSRTLDIDDHAFAEHRVHHIVTDCERVLDAWLTCHRPQGITRHRRHAARTSPVITLTLTMRATAKIRHRCACPVTAFAQMTTPLVGARVDTAATIE